MAQNPSRVRSHLSLWAAIIALTIPLFAQGSTPLELVPGTPLEAALLAGKGSKGGSRAGKSFTPAGKKEIDAANAAKNGGANKCENCGTDVVPGEKSQRGVTPPPNQRERDHIVPKSQGGDGTPANGQVLCRECNLDKSDHPQ